VTAIPLIALLYLLGSFIVGSLWIVTWVIGHGKRRRKKQSIQAAHQRLDAMLAAVKSARVQRP
jgi:hypothetical protein